MAVLQGKFIYKTSSRLDLALCVSSVKGLEDLPEPQRLR